MKHYLLLRDNKQSGPHTFEELLEMGLRSYDLLWVDGKSAAWRYPAEFPEFKDHAPAAPEQPFDRFYRKPVADQAVLPIQQKEEQEVEVPTLTRFMQEQEEDKKKEAERIRVEFTEHKDPDPAPTTPDQKGDDDGNRYVAVSLPAQDADRPIVVIGHTESSSSSHLSKKDEAGAEPVGRPVSALFPERDPLAAPRRPSPRQRVPWLQYVAILIGILSFMGLGILIGFNLSRSRSGSGDENGALRTDSGPANTNTQQLVTPAIPTNDSTALVRPMDLEPKASRKSKKDSNGNQPLVSGEIVHTEVPKELDPAVLQEEARKRREAEEKEKARNNISQLVGVQADKYKVGVFGGIGDLDVTVHNGSGYALDEVVVEVDYLLSNKKVYKTETLRFTDLASQASKTLTLPRTGRGVKAETRMVRIGSHELDLNWSR